MQGNLFIHHTISRGTMRIALTPGQAVTVLGWINPKLFLTWDDILGNELLTFSFLTQRVHIAASMLYKLQPDAHAWLQSKRVALSDCVEMYEHWKLHPIRDFKADLGDLIGTKWSGDTMNNIGLTYEDLVEAGLTPGTMALFTKLTLAGWVKVGFEKRYAVKIHESSLVRLFKMSKQDVMRALK